MISSFLSILISTLLIPTLSWSIPVQYYFYSNGQKVFVPIDNVENFSVNDLCYNHSKNCMALQKVKQKTSITQALKAEQGAYASKHCKFNGGVVLVMTDPKENESEFCVFKDKTMIKSWQLFGAHQGQQTSEKKKSQKDKK